MPKIRFYLVLPALLAAFAVQLQGQCTNNTMVGGQGGCPRSGNLYGTVNVLGCNTVTTIPNFIPGSYFLMPVLHGGCYTVSTCGCLDTQINAFEGTNTSGPFAYCDDNGPACPGSAASIEMVPHFTDFAAIDIRWYACQPSGLTFCNVQVMQNNNLQITSSPADMCEGDVRVFTAVPAPVASAPSGGGDPGTFTGPGVAGQIFTAPTPSGNSAPYTITYSFGHCTTSQTITVYHQPTAAAAGPDTMVIDTFITMQGNVPTFGTGTWSVVAGPGAIANPSSPSTLVTGLVAGSPLTLRWTIVNGPCEDHDDVVITVDTLAPTARCQAHTLYLDTSGTGILSPIDIDHGSSDNAGPVQLALDRNTFSCLDSGLQHVTLSVTDRHGNRATCDADVTVMPPTLSPTVLQNGNTLSATGTWTSYQWLLGGLPIPGATSPTFTAQQAGTYALLVTQAQGCVGRSVDFNLHGSVGLPDLPQPAVILLPNPNQGEFVLRLVQPLSHPAQLRILSLDGKTRFQCTLPASQSDLPIQATRLAAGAYWLEIVHADGAKQMLRMVLTH